MPVYDVEIMLEVGGTMVRLTHTIKAANSKTNRICIDVNKVVMKGDAGIIPDSQRWQGNIRALELIRGEVPPKVVEPITDRRGAIAAQKARKNE